MVGIAFAWSWCFWRKNLRKAISELQLSNESKMSSNSSKMKGKLFQGKFHSRQHYGLLIDFLLFFENWFVRLLGYYNFRM